MIRCGQCGAVALFDDGGGAGPMAHILPAVNKDDVHFYVADRLGKADWLSA